MSITILDLTIEYLIVEAAKLTADTYLKCLDPYIELTATAHLKSFSPSH